MKHDRQQLETIHARTFQGIDTIKEVKGNSYAIVEILLELNTLTDLYYKHMETELDIFITLYDHLATFYANNPQLLNESFSLVDNAYHVDLSMTIAEIEQQLQGEIK
jgi:hypothetical protein